MKRNTSKSKQVGRSHSGFWKSWKFLVLIAGAVLVLAIILIRDKQVQPPAPLPSSTSRPSQEEMAIVITDEAGKVLLTSKESEGVKLINDLLAAINPSKPENSYMTPFMKEKINWVYGEIAAKRLNIRSYAGFGKNSDGTDNRATFMSANYDSTKRVAYLELYVARLLTYTRLQQKVLVGFNQMVKSTFVLMFVHEATHLERPPEFFITPHGQEVRRAEENRVWFKVDIGAVRELRKIGQPVDSDFIEADDILKRCNDNPKCPEFVDFVNRKTG